MNTGSVLAQFTITLSKAVNEPVAVDWFTSDGTAKSGVDYAANKGTAVFAPGETDKKVNILVYGRAVGSDDRSFFVEMLPPTNAILGASIGECIIHVDTSGNQPVTQIIVPTGPKGEQGESAYQAWLDQGHSGTEADFLEWLKPSPDEIAEEVAPLIDVGDTVLTAADTDALPKPDTLTVKALARRVAYAQRTKIATVTLADGDNTISAADLTGDNVNLKGTGFVPRIYRGGAFITPEWRMNVDGSVTILAAVAGDELYATEHFYVSDYHSRESVLEAAKEYYDELANSFNVEYFGFNAGPGQNIAKLMDAFSKAEHLVFGGGIYYVDDFTMPSTAKCKQITILPGSRVQQNGWDCVINVKDTFTINMRGGGCWHGGLKKAYVTEDAAVGSTTFKVSNPGAFKVGDQITTSFLIPGNPGDEGDPNTWKWSNSPRYGEFNYITAIDGDTITVKNPVENRTLMRNVWVGNWMFSHQGLAFKGSGKVFINGGELKEFKTYGLTLVDVDCVIDGTNISGMTIDCFYIIGSASLTMRNFRFETCYDFGKLGIIHTSTGDIKLENGYWRRGNFDADINFSNQTNVTKFGKLILRNVTAIGTSTLRLPGDQIDTFTGQTANQIFGNRINPARLFCTIGSDSRDFEGQGFEAVNCNFLDYQRQVYGPEGAYPGNFRIDNLIMRDVITACGLFNLQVASGKAVVIRGHELRDLSVTRRYTVNYYPLYFISGGFITFSGLLKYNNGGWTGQDHRIETENCYIPEMEITGTGDATLVSPTFIANLLVREGTVNKMGVGQRNEYTNLVMLQNGKITGDLQTSPLSLQRLKSVDFAFNANDNTTWVTLYKNTDSLDSVDIRIELAPRKNINAAAGIMGTIATKLLKNGVSVSVVKVDAQYPSLASGNLAYWEGKALGTQGAIADGTVHLRCLSTGEVQININFASFVSVTALIAGA